MHFCHSATPKPESIPVGQSASWESASKFHTRLSSANPKFMQQFRA